MIHLALALGCASIFGATMLNKESDINDTESCKNVRKEKKQQNVRKEKKKLDVCKKEVDNIDNSSSVEDEASEPDEVEAKTE